MGKFVFFKSINISRVVRILGGVIIVLQSIAIAVLLFGVYRIDQRIEEVDKKVAEAVTANKYTNWIAGRIAIGDMPFMSEIATIVKDYTAKDDGLSAFFNGERREKMMGQVHKAGDYFIVLPYPMPLP